MSEFVAAFVRELKASKNLKVELTGMSTQVEADSLSELFESVEKAREKVFGLGVQRLVLRISIDERRDKPSSLKQKKDSVSARL